MLRTRVRVLVTGRVQGVFFRHETARRARAHEVAGWVRNLPTGAVEAVFEGPPDAVAAMVEWCATGPPAAVVADVETQWEEPAGETGFSVL